MLTDDSGVFDLTELPAGRHPDGVEVRSSWRSRMASGGLQAGTRSSSPTVSR
jgi:hypothetical protein